LRIGPRAPAKHCNDAEDNSERIILDNEHGGGFIDKAIIRLHDSLCVLFGSLCTSWPEFLDHEGPLD
jgi:hypothetical protein